MYNCATLYVYYIYITCTYIYGLKFGTQLQGESISVEWRYPIGKSIKISNKMLYNTIPEILQIYMCANLHVPF